MRPYFIHTNASDLELARRLNLALAGLLASDAGHLQFDVHHGDVILRGRVATALQKYQSRQTVRRLPGVREVIDLLEVSGGRRRRSELKSAAATNALARVQEPQHPERSRGNANLDRA